MNLDKKINIDFLYNKLMNQNIGINLKKRSFKMNKDFIENGIKLYLSKLNN
jgi:hypothetical protein